MKIFLWILIGIVSCSVREILKQQTNMMHHKLVKNYSQRMTNLMIKQRENYPCDRYLQDEEIDYTRQINVHHRNPVYGIIQLDNGKKFTLLNHAFKTNQSKKEIVQNLSFKPALYRRFRQRESMDTQMQCILYAKVHKRNYIQRMFSILVQVDFHSNCKDQKSVKFFELKGGNPLLNRLVIKNKNFEMEVEYMGEVQNGIVFNNSSSFYPDYKVLRKSYRPQILNDDFRWRWLKSKKRKRKQKRKLALTEFGGVKKVQLRTKGQIVKSQIQEQKFQKKVEKEMQRRLNSSNRKKKTKKTSKKRNSNKQNQRKRISKSKSAYVNRNSQSQMKDVEKDFEMIIPKDKQKQFFEFGVIDAIWNGNYLINCSNLHRKLQQNNNTQTTTKRKLFFKNFVKMFSSNSHSLFGKMVCNV